MEVKKKYEMEFEVNSSPSLLYQYLSTSSGLSDWFADNVNSRGEFFTFEWDGNLETARLASKKYEEKVKYVWVDENKKDTPYFFEMRIIVDEITQDVSLVVFDFAYENEIEEAKLLWENQIHDLKKVIGSA